MILNGLNLMNYHFSAPQHICLASYAIARPSVCLYVRYTRIDQSKTVEVIGSCNFHHTVAQFL